MALTKDMNAIVDGKRIRDWLMPDKNIVKSGDLFENISKNQDVVIYDFGPFVVDDEVVQTWYSNGVDLARAYAASYWKVPYDEVNDYEAIEGHDYVRISYDQIRDCSVADFITYRYNLLDGYFYISKESGHVMLYGRRGDEKERNAVYEEISGRLSDKYKINSF